MLKSVRLAIPPTGRCRVVASDGSHHTPFETFVQLFVAPTSYPAPVHSRRRLANRFPPLLGTVPMLPGLPAIVQSIVFMGSHRPLIDARVPPDARIRLLACACACAPARAYPLARPERGWGEQLRAHFSLYTALPQNFWKFSFSEHKTSVFHEQHYTSTRPLHLSGRVIWLRMDPSRRPAAAPPATGRSPSSYRPAPPDTLSHLSVWQGRVHPLEKAGE